MEPTADSSDPPVFKYWAFISYSHSDQRWSNWLFSALETYRVPKRFVGKDTGTGPVPIRLFPLFRDRDELPTSADLGANIRNALQESRFLIVICSPRAAKSKWVNEEILGFKRLGRGNHILPIIVEGEPNAADGKPGFDILEECLPPALRFRLGNDGHISEHRHEPICADVRKNADGKLRGKIKLISGLIGVSFDELWQREKIRLRNFLWTIAGFFFLAITVAGGLIYKADRESRRAAEGDIQRQNAEAERDAAAHV